MSNNIEVKNEENRKILLGLANSLAKKRGIHVDPVLFHALGSNYEKAAMLSQYIFVSDTVRRKEFLYQNDNFLYSIGSVDKIKKAKAWLVKEGLISVKLKGLPARSYITVNHEKIEQLLVDYAQATYDMMPEYMRIPQDGVPAHNLNGCGRTTIYKEDINKEDLSISAREDIEVFSPTERTSNPIKNFENSINRKSNYLKATIKQQQNISSEEKEENKEPWEKYPAFMKLWAKTPEFSRGCGIQDAFNEWMIETENGTKNVEEVDKGLTFHFKATPKDTKTKHLTKLLMYGTWKSFLFEANEVEKKKLITEEAKKERKTKEETEEKEYTNWQNFVAKYKEEMGVDIKQMIKEKEEKQNEHYR
jgi:hypothetical protein